MANEGARIRFGSGAHRLVIQEQLTRPCRPADDQFGQSALTDLSSAVDHHDACVRQRLNGQSFGMSCEQSYVSAHRVALSQVALYL